jgi:hypothetical protein
MSMRHPRPWVGDYGADGGSSEIRSADGDTVFWGDFDGDGAAEAFDLILRSVNGHDALLTASNGVAHCLPQILLDHAGDLREAFGEQADRLLGMLWAMAADCGDAITKAGQQPPYEITITPDGDGKPTVVAVANGRKSC